VNDSNPAMVPAPANTPAQLARRALFAFVLTFIAARTVVLLIMSHRMPNLYFFLRGNHVHHLNYGIFLLSGVAAYLLFSARSAGQLRNAALAYGVAMALTFDEFGMWLHLGGSYWQRASVDAIIIVAALLGLIGYATAIRKYESRHVRASIALLIALVVFSAVLYDTSLHIGRLEGPRLEALELSSSP
jgi:Ca2+/Na+ antiporter